MAESKSTPRDRKQAAKPEPITRHPLFPAIVALWFAALLGVGSLSLSTGLLERFVIATGIDTVIAAAAPPLGLKARLAVSLAFGLLGAAIGWFLARRVANPAPRPAPQVFKVAEVDPPKAKKAPKPVLDPASLAAEPIAAAVPPAVTAEIAPEVAPEPELPELIAPATDEPEASPEPVEVVAAEVIIEPQPAVAEIAPLVTEPFFAEPESREPTAAERIAAADLAELSHVELIERLAIALQRREALSEAEEARSAEPSPVVHFPDFADRRSVRPAPSAPTPLVAPQETEIALRHALAQLQRMSGTRGG
ncbi:hypothetical protein [Novosphingobium sp. JCM 18896]|uniref:hypothetical protein n=1 Tax=Novosphingobium sp. JCM 18896 TaxID=2989731 RepID=UPI002222A341|nr:hypothetical protein [Novosphingobium sp. JCM 18896]MCW1431829.1 hypothetical protein [Novosphingobium sp. JCM 18896]